MLCMPTYLGPLFLASAVLLRPLRHPVLLVLRRGASLTVVIWGTA